MHHYIPATRSENTRILTSVLAFLLYSCQKTADEHRNIRAHNLSQSGIHHAHGLNNAERYCQRCHGLRLTGGENFEPSCYSCHGKNWLDSEPDQVHAPRNHSELRGKWLHDPATEPAESYCNRCHGENLSGVEGGPPSCYLCHEKKWP